MAKGRLDKTLADYVVIAISPALIMTLVGSLVFFLLDVSYRGQFESRIHWIMFWYVFAAVLVARIAIIEGREHAQIFGIAMCAVAGIAVFRFVDAVLVGWLLLAVVWWSSSKLTWDCTLIDESVDTTGEGLLQSAGFDSVETTESPKAEPRDRQQEAELRKGRKKKKSKKPSKKRSAVDESGPKTPEAARSLDDDDGIEKSTPHAPGLWVVYFSLAALPLFGVGQLFIPAEETSRRSYEFVLLAVYVASAIMLLLTTSFLSLRRYLRQRKLEMPASMTRGWLAMGTALLVALLLLALVIPRPQGEYTLTGIIDKIDAKARKASQFAVLPGDRAEGEGARKGDQDPNAKQPGDGQPRKPTEKGDPSGKPQDNGQQGKQNSSDGQSDRQSQSKQSGDDKNGSQQSQSSSKSGEKSGKSDSRSKDSQNADRQQKEKGNSSSEDKGKNQNAEQRNADANSKPNQPDANKTPPPTPTTASATSITRMLAPFVRWILYGLLAIVGLYFLFRYWSRFVEFLAKLWAELLSLFVRRPKQKEKAGDKQEPAPRLNRPFASYENPFYSGAADRMTPPQLIRYTFEALEAWSREQSVERSPEQTPLEFAQELGERVPALAKDVNLTAQLYAHIAYARKVPSRERLEALERLWRRLVV